MQSAPTPRRVNRDDRSPGPPLSKRELERQAYIIAAAETLMANFSRDTLTIGRLALALRMTTAIVRRHFVDIDSILAEILLRHLSELAKALGSIPNDDPNRRALQRAAYIAATRDALGALTEPHVLLIRERHTLPDELAKPVEDLRMAIGAVLAGENAAIAMALLDAPELRPRQIEAMLAICEPTADPRAPATQAPLPSASGGH